MQLISFDPCVLSSFDEPSLVWGTVIKTFSNAIQSMISIQLLKTFTYVYWLKIIIVLLTFGSFNKFVKYLF